ncbi:gtpase-activator protein for Ras family gtpase [Pelomyxa schiedti]|nr:gtpase-activator protein for Ras family gtpase [Pelomyxa schiedti]
MEEFRRLVLTPEFGEWLCTVANTKDSQQIADLCVKVLEPEGRALPLIEFLIKKEIRTTNQAGILFRSNSLASKMMSAWSKLEDGQLYLQQVLTEPIKGIVAGNYGSLEINPINLADPSMLERNIAQLHQIIQRVFDAIVAGADKYPLRFRMVCSYLKQYCGEKFPESALICVAGFVVLRYFCPAIVAPDNTGILEGRFYEC